MRDIAIIGIGMTDFGELWNDSLRGPLRESRAGSHGRRRRGSIDGLVAAA